MKKAIGVALLAAHVAMAAPTVERVPARPAATQAVAPDSTELERRLQALTWSQFRAVAQAIPRIKADIDAYGALGWQYVQTRYKTYRWKKSIDKLTDDQKRELAMLIEQAKAGKLPALVKR